MPLLWLSLTVYVAGLGHFALGNASALRGLWADLVGVGARPGDPWAVLSSGRHGVELPATFVAGVDPVSSVDPVAASLTPLQWYGALAGVVLLTVATVVVARLARSRPAAGPVTFGETVVVALAVGVSTGLLGGPLLAGIVLAPSCYGVVVHYTRRRPGWTPSYLYVVPVFAPVAALAAGAAGYASLPVDLLAFVVLPLAGGIGLPLRATVRKRVGW